jgi:FtsP/CotA-like multicopper oxidase with cupredoxin domain
VTVSRRGFLTAAIAFCALPALAGTDERLHLVIRARAPSPKQSDEDRLVSVFDPQPAQGPYRARRNIAFPLSITNDLAEPVALHWRGLRAALATTGLTEMVLAPGDVAPLDLVAPDVGLLLLEARPIDGRPLRRRALLPVVVTDDNPAPYPDSTIIFAERSTPPIGLPIFVANEQPELTIPVAVGVPILLRCANGSAGHLFRLAVDGVPAARIGLDGQPTDSPTPWSAAGEEFLPGTRSDLLLAGLPSTGAEAHLVIDEGRGPRRIVRIVASLPAPEGGPGIPIMPPANPDLPLSLDLAGATRARLTIRGTFDPTPLTAKVGTTIVLQLDNRTGQTSIVHLRGQAVRQLHVLDDGWEPYWTDTLLVPSGSERLVAFIPSVEGEWRVEMSSPGYDDPPAVTTFIAT